MGKMSPLPKLKVSQIRDKLFHYIPTVVQNQESRILLTENIPRKIDDDAKRSTMFTKCVLATRAFEASDNSIKEDMNLQKIQEPYIYTRVSNKK